MPLRVRAARRVGVAVTARVLLVTGSRALYDTAEARAWTLDVLRARLLGSDAPTLVVTGDARGADAAASEIVRRVGPTVGIAVWELDGDVTTWAPGVVVGRVVRWTDEPELRWGDREGWRRRPLERNAAMVARCGEQARDGADVRCVALLAPWSTSGGTQHTMRLAREHGLHVEVLTCPEAYGPRGGR